MLDDADLAAAKWAWENDRPAGRGSDTLPGAKRLFLPMRTGRGAIGVVGIDSDKPGPLLTPDQRRLLDALIDQGALAIERVHLVEDMDRVKRNGRDRSAALGAAHLDLARPQDAARRACSAPPARCAISAASSTDAAKGRSARDDHRRIGAAQPLHRQPARHDQARVRRGRAECRACTISARSSAARCAAPTRSSRSIGSSSSSRRTCRCSQLDAVLFEQVLFNLLDNAAKYAPAGTTIRIPELARGRFGLPAGPRRRRRHSARRSRAHLRQVLSRAEGRPGARRHRPRASRSRAASSRPCAAPSTPPTAPIARARCSPSACRCPPRRANWTRAA